MKLCLVRRALLTVTALVVIGCSQQSPESGEPVRLGRWGPTGTQVGTPFNEQPGGGSGIWIEARNVAQEPGARLLLGEAPLQNVTVSTSMVTAAVPDALLQQAGVRDLVLVEPSGRRTLIGKFTITQPGQAAPPPAPAATAPQPELPINLQRWGPQSTQVGQVFNLQPSGDAGLWIEVTGVALTGTQLLFGGTPLAVVSVSDKMVTAAIPVSLLQQAGEREIVILEASGRKTSVGMFTVSAPPAK